MTVEMKNYAVIVNGENFWLETQDGVRKLGFYATRFIRATSRQEAERLALSMITNDKDMRKNIRNSPLDKPRLSIDKVNEVSLSADGDKEDCEENKLYMLYAEEQ